MFLPFEGRDTLTQDLNLNGMIPQPFVTERINVSAERDHH